MANEKNLKKGKATQFKSGEQAASNGAKGGRKSQQVQKQKKTVADYLKKWADSEISDEKSKKTLQALGLDEEATNRTLLVVPLIKKVSQGDTKALQMAIELLGEDRKKDLEIAKLKQEIELLRAETEKLRQQFGDDREVESLARLADMLKYES